MFSTQINRAYLAIGYIIFWSMLNPIRYQKKNSKVKYFFSKRVKIESGNLKTNCGNIRHFLTQSNLQDDNYTNVKEKNKKLPKPIIKETSELFRSG